MSRTRATTSDLLERTKILVSAGPYVSAAEAAVITRQDRSTIQRKGAAGLLSGRTVGKARVYDTSAVLGQAYRRGQLLLPDVLRTAAGEHLDETDLAHELTTHQEGTWYTLSRRDHRLPDWPSWSAWSAGDEKSARALLVEEQRQRHLEVQTLARRGLIRRQLWFPTFPLTPYGRYQVLRYRLLSDAGAYVRALAAWTLANVETHGPMPDLEVLPDAVYVRCHTRSGARDGAIRVANPGLVSDTHDLAHWLYTTQASHLGSSARNQQVPA